MNSRSKYRSSRSDSGSKPTRSERRFHRSWQAARSTFRPNVKSRKERRNGFRRNCVRRFRKGQSPRPRRAARRATRELGTPLSKFPPNFTASRIFQHLKTRGNVPNRHFAANAPTSLPGPEFLVQILRGSRRETTRQMRLPRLKISRAD